MQSIESLVKEIGANSAAIMAPNLAKEHLYCYDSYNMPSEWVKIKNRFEDYTSYGNAHVYITGKPVITNSIKTKLKGYYIESVMIVPVIRKGSTLGTLELIHSKNNKVFTNDDLQKAIDFADQIEIERPK